MRESRAFAMEFLAPERHPVWKAQLRDGKIEVATAAEVARRIVAVHRATAGDAEMARRFATDPSSMPSGWSRTCSPPRGAIRTAPARSSALAEITAANKRRAGARRRQPEEHPRRADGPVLLDAECAWYGDPAFDLAFCLNHLLLKCLWTPAVARRHTSPASTRSPRTTSPASTGKPADGARGARGAAAAGLFLARVDGKSPVEYISARTSAIACGGVARALICRSGAPRLRAVGRRLARGSSLPHEATATSARSTPAVSGIRAAARRSRPRSRSPAAPTGRAIAPAGASRGTHEAIDLRDGGRRHGGLGVDRAVANVNGEIAKRLRGMDAQDQEALDRALVALDGTPQLARLGGNAVIATSMAALHAAAAASGASRCGPTWRRRPRAPADAARSRSSAAAPTRGAAWTSRTSW